jgi:hypothetical protein
VKLAKLTAPNGSPVWISPAFVEAVRKPLAGETVGAANTAVHLISGHTQMVREFPADVVAGLESMV